MERRRQSRPYTEWGKRVTMYCLDNDITKKQLAEMAQVSYGTLAAVVKGLRAGYDVIPAVDAVMERGAQS